LRHRPLLHVDPEIGFALVHAGFAPQWNISKARACADEVESTLRGPKHTEFFQHMYGDQPDRWDDALQGWERLRFIVNCFTRLRYVDDSGRAMLKAKGAPDSNKHLTPWFRVGARKSKSQRIVFGHWSTLGLVMEHNVFALDTGCVWGGALTALRLDETPVPIAVDCPGARVPGGD
jgi:bis(5'-nucleosyl)-tetraphosphatase (symmetrical)